LIFSDIYNMFNLPSLFKPEFADQYSPKDALAFAAACTLAYENDLPIEEITDVKANTRLADWGFSKFQFFSKTLGGSIDTQGFVAEYQNKILIAFRGSSSTRDWMTNIEFVTDPGPLVE